MWYLLKNWTPHEQCLKQPAVCIEHTLSTLLHLCSVMGLRSARTSYFLMYELNEPQRRWHASLPCTYRRMTMAAQSCCNHFDRYLVGVITVLSKFSFALKTICQLMVMWHLWGSVPNNSTFSHIWRFFFFRCFVTHFTFWNVKKKKWISVIFCSIVKPNT